MQSDWTYVLDAEGRPVREPDLLEWAAWLARTERHVGEDHVAGSYRLSTVFLGIDHRHGGEGDPVLWETALFATGQPVQILERYASQEAARAGHARWLAQVSTAICQ